MCETVDTNREAKMAGSTADAAKRRAAEHAVSFVRDGMIVGIGTGSTVTFAIDALLARIRDEHLRIVGVPTSHASEKRAAAGGCPIADLNDVPTVDLTIDGADEVDPRRDLIKGAGGALLREKLVALASRRVVVIADEAKLVEQLGERMLLPVEVVPFGWRHTANRLTALGLTPTLRIHSEGERPFETDNANYIFDCTFPARSEATELAVAIKETAGVVEHGFFLGIAHTVIIGTDDGIEILGSMSEA